MSNARTAEYIIKLIGQDAGLRAQTQQAVTNLQQVSTQSGAATRASNALSSSLKGLALAGAAAFSVDAIFQFGKASVNAYEESVRAQAKVAQAIKTTGGVAGQSLKELTAIAAEFQASTLFEDDAILNGVTAQLLTFTNIAGENFKRAQAAALDLATVLDGDLQGAAIQLGKALNDPTQGLSALSRSGISFSEQQKATIKDLADTNRLAEAQALILNELARQYGGQAEAAAKASNGVIQFKNSLGDTMEVVGEAITKGGKLKTVMDTLGYSMAVAFNPKVEGSSLIALLDGLTGGDYARRQVENMRKMEAAMGNYLSGLAKFEEDEKSIIPVFQKKERTLNQVTKELDDAVTAQKATNTLDLAAVAAIKKKVSALTLEKEALEKLFAVQKPREAKGNLKAMDQRLNITPVVSDKKITAPHLMTKKLVPYQEDVLVEYGRQMDIITQKQLLYGDVLQTVISRKEETQAAIDGLLNKGYSAESLEVQSLMDKLVLYDEQQNQITGISQKATETLLTMGGAFNTLGSAIGGAAGSWISFAGTIMEQLPTLITQITALTTTQVLGSQQIAGAKNLETMATNQATAAKLAGAAVAGVTAATEVSAAGAITTAKSGQAMAEGAAGAAKVPFPGSLIALALVVASIGAIIAAIPKPKKFAAGGIVSGPTLGLMGEYPGASTNPEVIAPLSKLKGMIADRGASGIVVDDIVLEGTKIRYILKAVDRQIAART